MAAVTYVFSIDYVANLLDEDPELLQAIVSNDDNLSYGSIISVYTGPDETITSLTRDGMEELEQMDISKYPDFRRKMLANPLNLLLRNTDHMGI